MIKINKNFENIPKSLKNNPPKIDQEVRNQLANEQFNKCCYCEDGNIKGTVEHFKPKSKFPELEFDWENLLWACGDCNNLKNNKFDVDKPIINPLNEEAAIYLKFDIEGKIFSDNIEMSETIKTCDLSRKNLNDKRKEIFDDLIRNLNLLKEINKKSELISFYYNSFVKPILENKNLNFIAFRTFIVENYTSEILK